MGAATTTLGVLLIVGGIIGYFYTQSELENMEGWTGSVGRALSSGMEEQYQQLKMINVGSIIAIVIGGVFVLAGLMGGSQQKTSEAKGKVKRKVVVKPGTKTAKCPICQFPLDVTTQTGGTCPKCKNEVEVYFEG